MERAQMENGLSIPLIDHYQNDFGLIDFMDEANLDQFIDLVRGENEPQSIGNFNSQSYGNNFNDHFIPPVELFDFEVATGFVGNTDFSMENACQKVEGKGEVMDVEESSGTTMTTEAEPTKKKSSKLDRSRTLISERRRRGRMKEKLYALRSLVPNITKMDKASIVGDAVLYLQDLQTQAKKLKSEISNLESSLKEGDKYNGKSTNQNVKKINSTNFYPIIKKIFKVDVFQVEEKGFYVRIVSNKGRGVAVCLYKALESLTSFHVQSSNLAVSAENYVLTFNLHINGPEMDVDLPNLKLWIASIFLNQGFEFETSQSA